MNKKRNKIGLFDVYFSVNMAIGDYLSVYGMLPTGKEVSLLCNNRINERAGRDAVRKVRQSGRAKGDVVIKGRHRMPSVPKWIEKHIVRDGIKPYVKAYKNVAGQGEYYNFIDKAMGHAWGEAQIDKDWNNYITKSMEGITTISYPQSNMTISTEASGFKPNGIKYMREAVFWGRKGGSGQCAIDRDWYKQEWVTLIISYIASNTPTKPSSIPVLPSFMDRAQSITYTIPPQCVETVLYKHKNGDTKDLDAVRKKRDSKRL